MFVPSRIACKRLGLCSRTLIRYADRGEIEHYRTESGQRLYNVDAYLRKRTDASEVCYCRVSSAKQKDDLQRQEQFMRVRYPDSEIISDIGSGLNFKRKGLQTILDRLMSGDKLKLIIAHRDRLARFGLPMFEYLISKNGGELVVLSTTEQTPQEELTTDLLAILHVFSARMHGLRKYSDQIKKDKSLSGQKSESSV